MINQLYTLRAMSQIHCGIGQGLNDIDLPTARNKVSGHPLIPASSLKGVLKDEFMNKTEDEQWLIDCVALFGGDGSSDHASAISVGDANLLALTVRSFFGTYAYLASPYTLMQLKQLFKRSNWPVNASVPQIGIDKNTESYKIQVCHETILSETNNNRVLLEELDFLIDKNSADEWADIIAPLFFDDEEGQTIFKKRFAIVDDNALNFICDTGLPVDARIAIDEETGTVKNGALWYEETVPAESLFIGNMSVDRSYHPELKKQAKEFNEMLFNESPINCQVGGKSTTGKGFVEINFQDKDKDKDKSNGKI